MSRSTQDRLMSFEGVLETAEWTTDDTELATPLNEATDLDIEISLHVAASFHPTFGGVKFTNYIGNLNL